MATINRRTNQPVPASQLNAELQLTQPVLTERYSAAAGPEAELRPNYFLTMVGK